mgnify:CR=1 FL=1
MIKRGILIIFVLFAICDSAEANWIRRADFGAQGRHRGTGCGLSHRGYFGLGHYNGTGINIVLKDWWEYDPATNAWTQKADYIGGNVNGNYAVLTFGIGNYAFITGGTFSDVNTYRYDPTINQWDIVATAPQNFSNTEGFVLGNKGYVVSGSVLHEFDATTLQWSTKNPVPFNSSIWNGAFSIGEKGYVRTSSGFYEYKPSTDAWGLRASFPGLATAASMNFAQDGKGYVICGYGGGLSNVNSEVWQYEPLTNTWNQLEEFPGTSRRFGSSFSIGDRSFVGIGTNGTNFSDFWEFDADLIGLSTDYLSVEQVSVYPNPAVEEINVKLDAFKEFEVTLYDNQGKVVNSSKTTTGQCKILRDNLPAGNYFVRISVLGNYLGSKTIIFN